jgi:hypothetical protein
MDQPDPFRLQTCLAGLAAQSGQSPGRENQKKSTFIFKGVADAAEQLRKVYEDFVAGQGFLFPGVDPAGVQGPVGGVGDHRVESGFPEESGNGSHVPPQQTDPVFPGIEPQVAGGQVQQPGLHLQSEPMAPGGPGHQQQRQDPAAGPQIEDPVGRPQADEIRQEQRVQGKAIACFFL